MFTVNSRDGTVTGPGGTVRLEPKVMEVLHLLSQNSGHVVPRDELMDAVWPDVVVTEHTLSRCIYQLRQQLREIADASDEPLIETLPKRGYRLLADVGSAPARAPDVRPALPAIPYVVGQWVRGERFYGRAAQIAEILDGPRNCIWLLGTRRIGKTSLLKQLEHIANTSAERRYFPLFWDFQGAATPGELHMNFTDALLDAEDDLDRLGIDVNEVESDDLFVSLERLRRQLRGRKLGLLLLCDEVEELIELQRNHPALLRKLRHAMQSREDIRTVLASTIRLWALADGKEDTSPFLHGFTPPLYIERLSDEEARALIVQSHLVPEQRPVYTERDVEAIRAQCDCHPYLMQLVCKRYLECGKLDEAIERVATDRMVSYFFSVDFDMLSNSEQAVVRAIAGRAPCSFGEFGREFAPDADELAGILRRLQDLGFVRGEGPGAFILANDFFRRWIEGGPGDAISTVAAVVPASAPVEDPALPNEASRAGRLFVELKRRKVFRVGIGYIVVAWLLLQVAEILFDFFDVPDWAGKLLVVLLLIGLPLALFLAWALELTPEGIRRDRDVERSS